MKMKIPDYKPTSNHVHLSDKGEWTIKILSTSHKCESPCYLVFKMHILFVPGDTLIELSVEIRPTEISLSATDNITPPTSMALIKSVEVGPYPMSVHSYDNKIYLGQYNSCDLLRYDLGLSGGEVLLTGNSDVTSVQAYNDELYVWFAQKDLINVYDMTGELKRSWKHYCRSKDFNKLRVLSNRVVVPNAQNQALTVYNLHGHQLRQIKCPGFRKRGSHKAMAVCGDDSVVVSEYETNSVFRVNINSCEVMWMSKHVQYPQGVVCYKNRYVLVTSHNTDTRIWILDAGTGGLLSQ